MKDILLRNALAKAFLKFLVPEYDQSSAKMFRSFVPHRQLDHGVWQEALFKNTIYACCCCDSVVTSVRSKYSWLFVPSLERDVQFYQKYPSSSTGPTDSVAGSGMGMSSRRHATDLERLRYHPRSCFFRG